MKALAIAVLFIVLAIAPAVHALQQYCDPLLQQYDTDAYQSCLDADAPIGEGSVLGINSASGATAKNFVLFSYRWEDDPGDSPLKGLPYPSAPFQTYLPQPGNNARLASSNVPLSTYLPNDINPCAYIGTLTGAGFDDNGWVTIGGASINTPGDACGGTSNYHPGTGTFDPQTALVSWFFNNKCDGNSGIWANVQIGYKSQNGYAWDGASCTKPVVELSATVDDTSPLEGTNVTLVCAVTNGDIARIVPGANDTSVTFAPLGTGDGEARFTFNVGGRKDLVVDCAMDDNTAEADIIRVGGLPDAPELSAQLQCIKTRPDIVNITWRPVAGAASYAVSENGILNSTSNDLHFARGGFEEGKEYTFSVAGLTTKGQTGASAEAKGVFSCLPPAIAVPGSFHHAYFARVRDRSVTAYWNEESGAVLAYQHFTTDFSALFPNHQLYSDQRQAVWLSEADPKSADDVRLWRRYTSGLRIDPAAR